jgi:hypothetical protein
MKKEYLTKKGQQVKFLVMPHCTERSMYNRWKELARLSGNLPARFCTDCTSAFQAKMLEEGRCDQPGIKFYKTKEGFIDGYLPFPEKNKDE